MSLNIIRLTEQKAILKTEKNLKKLKAKKKKKKRN